MLIFLVSQWVTKIPNSKKYSPHIKCQTNIVFLLHPHLIKKEILLNVVILKEKTHFILHHIVMINIYQKKKKKSPLKHLCFLPKRQHNSNIKTSKRRRRRIVLLPSRLPCCWVCLCSHISHPKSCSEISMMIKMGSKGHCLQLWLPCQLLSCS